MKSWCKARKRGREGRRDGGREGEKKNVKRSISSVFPRQTDRQADRQTDRDRNRQRRREGGREGDRETVTKSDKFWRAIGQSNLAYQRLAANKTSKFWFSYSHSCTLTNGAVFHSVCQVWLSSGPPEFITFSYCAVIVRLAHKPNFSWRGKITQSERWQKVKFLLCSCSRTKLTKNIKFLFITIGMMIPSLYFSTFTRYPEIAKVFFSLTKAPCGGHYLPSHQKYTTPPFPFGVVSNSRTLAQHFPFSDMSIRLLLVIYIHHLGAKPLSLKFSSKTFPEQCLPSMRSNKMLIFQEPITRSVHLPY